MSDLTDAVLRAVAAEREHQDEKWGPGHDDEHSHGELAIASAAMLLRGTDFAIDNTDEQVIDLPWLEAWGLTDKYGQNEKRRLLIAAAWAVAELERVIRREQVNAMVEATGRRFKGASS